MRTYFSLIVPCYNEQEVITTAYNQIVKDMAVFGDNYELIFVNDGSKDNTWEILKTFAATDKKVKLISLSRNFGQEAAIRAGLENASGDYIGFIDADLQDPPHLIPQMLEKMKAENADVCYGQRTSRAGETKFKLITANFYYSVFNYLTDIKNPPNVSNFRVFSRRVADHLISLREQDQCLRSMVTFIGYKQIPFPFERPGRTMGETKYTLKKLLSLAEDGIIAFSSKLLKFPIVFALITAILGLTFLLLSIFGITFEPNLNAIMNAIYSTLILGSIGLVGVYMNKIYANTKNRPIYIIDEKINFEED